MLKSIIKFFHHADRELRHNRWIFMIILITASLSLLAAFVLSVEAIQLIKNPNAQLGCSINIIINCATVAKSEYAALFGFPNSFIGLMAMPVFMTIAIAGLFDVKFPKQLMFAAQIIFTMCVAFAFALFYISSFLIQALCPWCMLVMLCATMMFFAVTRYNVNNNHLYLRGKLEKSVKKFIKHDYDILTFAIIVVAVVAFIIVKYGSALFA